MSPYVIENLYVLNQKFRYSIQIRKKNMTSIYYLIFAISIWRPMNKQSIMNKQSMELSQTKQASVQRLKQVLQQFSSQQIFIVIQKIFPIPIQASIDSTVSLVYSMEKYARTNITKPNSTFQGICSNIWQIVNDQDAKIGKVLKPELIAQVLQPIKIKWNVKPSSSQTFNPFMNYGYQQQFSPTSLFYPNFANFTGQPANYLNYINYPSNYSQNYSSGNISMIGQNMIPNQNYGSSISSFSTIKMAQNSNSSNPLNHSIQQIQSNPQRQNIPTPQNIADVSRNYGNSSSKLHQDINSSINISNPNDTDNKPQPKAQLPSQMYLNKINLQNNTILQKSKNKLININKLISINLTNLGDSNQANANKTAQNNQNPISNQKPSSGTIKNNSKTTILSNPQPKSTIQVEQRLNSNFQDYFTQSNNIINLIGKQKCICGKDSSTIEREKEEKFKCYHCEQYYHVNCQRRSNNCLICYMKLMVPTYKVKHQIFVGHLPKNKKKHEMSFEIDDVIRIKEQGLTIQVRCIRILEYTQNINLFPDAVTVEFNKQTVKDFQPLHKQSSLKYRKDQILTIPQYMLKKSNRVQLTQKTLGKDNRQDRIQPENHIVGIYAVQQQNSKHLAKQIMQNFMSNFNDSKELLDNSFKLSSEQLSCYVLKIPLTCTLTTEKISIPARGIFCKHFQCFDLQNYISLISMSTTPKWFCPLCKKPAYEFVIDSILFQIIKQAPYNKELTHAMFKEDGVFQIFSKQQVIKQGIRNIYDLPIESKFKRQAQEKQLKQETDNKKKKVCRQIPESAKIIELSD